MDIEEAFDINTIQLEPRLQEYIRRKRFNEENDIEPPISEEQEFCITPYDLKMIKKFKKGTKKLYSSKRLSKDPHFVETETTDFEIDFKKDPRYKRLQKKMQSHKDAQNQIRNLDAIDEDYTIFHQSNPYDLKPTKKSQRIAKPYDDPNNDIGSDVDSNDSNDNNNIDEFMMNSRDFVLAPSRPVKTDNGKQNVHRNDNKINMNYNNYNNNERNEFCYNPNRQTKNFNTYHHPSNIAYKQYLKPQKINGGIEHSRNINDIIGNLDSYNKHLDNSYSYIHGVADLDTKTFISGSNAKTQREMQTGYRSVPFMYANGLPDVSLEDSMRGGFKDSSKKSIGFKNPFEHQFDYISGDISDPNHTVQMWPQSTRGENKQISRPNSRAVKSEKRLHSQSMQRK